MSLSKCSKFPIVLLERLSETDYSIKCPPTYKKFKCQYCEKAFAQKSTLCTHRKIHKEKEVTNVKCVLKVIWIMRI